MINKSVIIIPFALPWDWSGDYERQTALTLSKRVQKVIVYLHEDARFFLKPSHSSANNSLEKNIIFFRPLYLIPFRRFYLIDYFNQLLNFFYLYLRFGFFKNKDVILWIFNPIFWFSTVILRFLPGIKSLYDSVDYAWNPEESFVKKIQKDEKLLIRAVNYFFVNSHVLANLHRKIRMPTAIVPQGFALNDFQTNIRTTRSIVHNKPIIGYIGSIVHRLDFSLLSSLIKYNPQWNFVFCSFIQGNSSEKSFAVKQISKLKKFANVIIIKSVDRKYVPGIIKQFDVSIIPYDTQIPLNRYCYPMKLFEYFYMGKPVVSTPIEELKRYPRYVKIGRSAVEWEALIKDILSKPWPVKYKNLQRHLAIANSWDNKIKKIGSICD